MLIDNITIIISIIALLLTILSVTCNPFFRTIKVKKCKERDNNNLPSITIVVLSQNDEKALDNHLPLILSQNYTPGFEVVVVGEKGDLGMETILGKYASNKKLYSTYIPKRSLFMSKQKLCASLGIKAAHNEWIIMLNASYAPSSDKWLQTIAEDIYDDTNLVIGYSNYKKDVKVYRRFIRLREACYYLRQASRGLAYRSTGANIAFKRSEFICRDGYRGNLQHVYGEYDFIINKFAKTGCTAISLNPNSFLRQNCSSKKSWKEFCISNSQVGSHLQRKNSMRLTYIFDTFFMYLNYVILIVTGIYSGLTSRWISLAIVAVCFIATISLRTYLVKRKCSVFDEDISAWFIPFFELSLVWFDMLTKLRYIKADKHDFSTHKI